MPAGNQWVGLAITAIIIVAVMLMRNRRPRRVRLGALWIRPLIYIALIAVAAFARIPPITPLGLICMVSAIVVGGVIGWQRGRFMHIDVHPETHDITSQTSPIGMLFILGIFVLRMGLRDVAGAIPGVPAAVAASSLILLVGAMMIARSAEVYLRARRLLGEARGARSENASPGANPPIVR
jgi:hypothetical protein